MHWAQKGSNPYITIIFYSILKRKRPNRLRYLSFMCGRFEFLIYNLILIRFFNEAKDTKNLTWTLKYANSGRSVRHINTTHSPVLALVFVILRHKANLTSAEKHQARGQQGLIFGLPKQSLRMQILQNAFHWNNWKDTKHSDMISSISQKEIWERR